MSAMSGQGRSRGLLRTYQLATPREPGEGLRVGVVRFPPRGVPRADLARLGYYDVWLPALAPSRALLAWIRSRYEQPSAWRTFRVRYARELAAPEARRLVELLAAAARRTPIAIGCYCEDEARCHRSVLRRVIAAAMR